MNQKETTCSQDAPEKFLIDIGRGFWMEYDEYLYEGYVVVSALCVHDHQHHRNSFKALESLVRLLLFDNLYGEDYMTIYFKHRFRLPQFTRLLKTLKFEEIPRSDFPKAYQVPRNNKAVRYYRRQGIKSHNSKGERMCNNDGQGGKGNAENFHRVIDCPSCGSQMHSWDGGRRFKCENPNCGYKEER